MSAPRRNCSNESGHFHMSSSDHLCPPGPFSVVYAVSTEDYIGDAEWSAFEAAGHRALKEVTAEHFPELQHPFKCDDNCGFYFDTSDDNFEAAPIAVFRTEKDYPGPPKEGERAEIWWKGVDAEPEKAPTPESQEDAVAQEILEASAEEIGSKAQNLTSAWPRWLAPAKSILLRDVAEDRGFDRSVYAVVTRLNRGYCVYVRFHHVVGDGASLAIFVNAWSARTKYIIDGKNGSAPAPKVTSNRALLTGDPDKFDPEDLPTLASFPHVPFGITNDETRKMLSGFMGKTEIESMIFKRSTIESVRSSHKDLSGFTSNDIIAAVLIKKGADKAIERGLHLDPEGNKMGFKLQFPANLRSRLDTIDETYFGNAVTFCATEMFDIEWAQNATLAEIASQVSEGKKKFANEKEFNRLARWEAHRETRPRGIFFPINKSAVLGVLTNWAHFPLYGADWGIGSLELVFPFEEHLPQYIGYILPSKNKDEFISYFAYPTERPPPFPGM